MGNSPVGDKTFVTAKKLKMKLKKNGEEVFNFAKEENRAKGNRMKRRRRRVMGYIDRYHVTYETSLGVTAVIFLQITVMGEKAYRRSFTVPQLFCNGFPFL